jgi:outer membrane protein assembly factor BamB
MPILLKERRVEMGILESLNLKKEGRLAEKWNFTVGSHILCGPLVDDVNHDGSDEIIIATKDGRILLLDLYANKKWEYAITEKIDKVDFMFMEQETVHSVFGTPRAADIDGDGKKEIVFGTQLGSVYALSCEGKFLWKFESESAIKGSVAFADVNMDGRTEVIFGSDDKKLYVLSNKGKLLWSYNAGAGIQVTPAVSKENKLIIFGDDEGKVNCVSFERKLLWSFKTGDKIVAEAVVKNLGNGAESVLIGSTDNTLYVLDINGNLKWSYPTQGSIIARPVLYDLDGNGTQEIILPSCDNTAYAITNDGAKVWSYETNFWVAATPIVLDIDNDGKVEIIVGSYDHNVYVLNADGSYVLDHIPGLSGIIHQAGHYSDIQTQDAGETMGKRIWQFAVPDIVIGMDVIRKTRNIIVTVKTGTVLCLEHTKA